MAHAPKIQNQRGFTLIEALFSAIVLGIGLLALAGFHAVALQDGAAVKMRMVATNLAQAKLDDLKSFSRLDGGATECGAGVFCYSEIADDAGGQEDDSSGNLVLPAGELDPVSATVYTRAWSVLCYSESAGAAASLNADCSDADSKLVTVTIAWTDNRGAGQSTSLQGMIYGLNPSNMASAAANTVSSAKPQIIITPPPNPPTETGQGTQQSSVPLPTVSSKGYSLSTSFETIVYNSSNVLLSRQENNTVNCVCEFNGTAAAYPASYFYWDGAKLAVKTPSTTIAKQTGTAPSIQGDTQNALCDICCRDHHDSEAPGTSNPTTALYDPSRPTSDYVSGDHKHYYYSDSDCAANPNAVGCDKTEGIQAVTSGKYLESCRFIRVDGIWRVIQDWQAKSLVVVPNSYLTTSSTFDLYDAYRSDLMRYVARTDCSAASGTGCSNITQSSEPNKSTLTNRDLSDQTPLTYHQLLAYSLYIDKVYGATTPRTLDSAYYTDLASKIVAFQADSTKLDWRDMISFNEVNVTLIASWHSSDADVISVANETIKNIDAADPDYYGVYRRGRTQVKSGTGGYADIRAYLLPSNSGLNGGVTRQTYTGMPDYNGATLAVSGTILYSSEIGIDRHDHATRDPVQNIDLRKSDSVRISRAGSTSSSNKVTGQIISGNSSASPSVTITASGSPSISCTVTPTGTTGSFTGIFECPVSSGYSGTITITSSVTGAFFDYGSNGSDTTYDTESADGYQNACTVSGVSGGTVDCGLFWVFGPTINVSGTLYCTGQACNRVACTDSASTTCAVSGSTITAYTLPLNSSHTWTGSTTLANTGSYTHVIRTPATAASDCNSGSSSAKTTSNFTAGPADGVGAFTFCAK